MNRFIEVVMTALFSLGLISGSASSQQTPSSQSAVQTRTRAIVASFNKSKHAVKERHGVRVEKYKEIRSEPVIKKNARDYAGSYEVPGLDFAVELRVDPKGSLAGTGYEPVDMDATVLRRFTLRNPRIDGALLTATKVYENGASEPFEGVFINLTSFDSPTDRGVTTFGLGVVGSSVRVSGVTVDRLFYHRKQ
jgi:hypothetical protein